MRNLNLSSTSAYVHAQAVKPRLSLITKKKVTKGMKSYVFYLVENDLYWFSECNSISGKVNLTAANYATKNPDQQIIGIEEMFNSILLLFDNGLLVEFFHPFERNNIEPSSTIDREVTSMSWSPDFQRVLFVCPDDKAILMSCYFESIREIEISSLERPEVIRASVGWGQKETQFTGPGMRRKQTDITDGTATSESTSNNSNTYLTWQEDSSAFAMNFFCKNSNFRKIKIFNNSGILQYVTENISGILEPISWQPSRRFIGIVQFLSGVHKVLFLEQNALPHSSFELPGECKVKNLFWNSSSDILAVHCVELGDFETIHIKECIFLFVVSNYKWYLKQRLEFGEIHAIEWDEERPNRMHILVDRIYKIFDWNWKYDVSYPLFCEHFESIIANIDYKKVQMTFPNKAILPPPESACDLSIDTCIDYILFPQGTCSGINCYTIAIVTKNRNLYFYKFPKNDFEFNEPFFKYSFEENPESALLFYKWFWHYPEDIFYFSNLEIDLKNNQTFRNLCISKFDYEKKNLIKFDKIRITHEISSICLSSKGILFLFENNVFKLFNGFDELLKFDYLEVPCQAIELFVDIVETNFGILGLSADNLYLNNVSYFSDVVSFYWTDPYVILVTKTDVLEIWKFFRSSEKSKVISKKILMSRKLESGMRFLTLLGSTVIFQHSRGNLETIIPRPFVIAYLHWLLKKKFYLEAFYYLRKMRISSNMLFDHNPKSFVENITNFVKSSLHNTEIISEFIGELDEKNYALELYKDIYSDYYDDENRFNNQKNKISIVCEVLINSMLTVNEKKFSLQILSSYVKCGKFKEALEFGSSNNLISYLIKIVKGKKLFQSALSIYRLDLALQIARMSQLDPTEYQSILDDLNEMDENYRRFTINKLTGNFKEALFYFSNCDEKFQECLSFIKEHKLYLYAIELFKNNPNRYEDIINLYGDYLYENQNFEESAKIFEISKNYEKSINGYKLSGNWRSALSIARKLQYSDDNFEELGKFFLDQLKTSKKYSDGAELANFYLGYSVEAVKLYALGFEFSKSIDLCFSVDYSNELLQFVKDQIIIANGHFWKKITKTVDLILSYSNRLKVIKEEVSKNKDGISFLDDDSILEMYEKEPSIIESIRSSSKVSISSKSSHKTEKRLWNLKEGNPREEIALYKQLNLNLTDLNKMSEEVNEICSSLLRLNEFTRATRLQEQYNNALTLSREISAIIWPCSFVKDGGYDDIRFRCPPILITKKCSAISGLKND